MLPIITYCLVFLTLEASPRYRATPVSKDLRLSALCHFGPQRAQGNDTSSMLHQNRGLKAFCLPPLCVQGGYY